jgi:hypothetical protein
MEENRSCQDEWNALVDVVHVKAATVNSDIDEICTSLEQGEWDGFNLLMRRMH